MISTMKSAICTQQFPQPWVIGYSGGKDSTTVLQLIWKALERLPAETAAEAGVCHRVRYQS